MLRKTTKENTLARTASQADLPQTKHQQVKDNQIKELFCAQSRVVYELDYLYHSPLYEHCAPFKELVQILEHYNQLAKNFITRNSYVEGDGDPPKVRLAVIGLLYRQMMCMANKEVSQVKITNHVSKLKDWYYGLEDMHSFLDGVNIKKKQKLDTTVQDNDVRASFVSNVYDEINEYIRRKVDLPLPPKASPPLPRRFPPPDHSVPCNLPMIDRFLYKRADLKLRETRQKQLDRRYLQAISNHKCQMRQNSLTQLTKISKLRDLARTQLKNTSASEHNNLAFMTIPGHFYSKQTENIPPSNIETNKNININRKSLSSINGINLIRQ